MKFKKVQDLNMLFSKAGDIYCHEEGCYSGSCPVNCLAFLLTKHLQSRVSFMIFGDYMLIKRLAKVP